MARRAWLNCLLLGGLVWFTCCQGLAFPQELLGQPELVLEGPEHQSAYAFVRYFNNRQCSQTVNIRMQIEDGASIEQLEFGHEGTRVLIAIPTSRPVTVSLRNGSQVVVQAQSDSSQVLELALGEIPEDDSYVPPRVMLDDTEKAFVRSFLAAMVRADTKSLVSDSKAANIQWQTLDAYCSALQQELGPAEVSSDLDGWLSWSGNLGTRVISGNIEFQRGNCQFSLMVIDGLLLDVVVHSGEMPIDWFQGPSSTTAYVEIGEVLARKLFDEVTLESAAEIQQLFAPKYHPSVPVAGLQELSRSLRSEYGQRLEWVRWVNSEIEPYASGKQARILSVFHELCLKTGKHCISQSNFSFSSGPNVVGRGDLASVVVRETWPSAQPELAELASKVLRQLSSGEVRAEDFHPSVREIIDFESLHQAVSKIRTRFGKIEPEPDFSAWNADRTGENAFATGVVSSDIGPINVRFDFFEDALIGVTLLGHTQAWTSAVELRGDAEAAQMGERFWTHLFQRKYPDAHRLLSPEFKDNLPLSEFEKLVSRSDYGQNLEEVQISIEESLLVNRLDRPLPAMLTTYFLAKFQDGSYQPLRCEFARDEGQWELLNFSTDFQGRFPMDGKHEAFEALMEALSTRNSDALVWLLSDKLKARVEPAILSGFLRKLAAVTGNMSSTADYRQIHDYVLGGRYEHLSAELQTDTGPLPLNATFQYGKLISFSLQSPNLAYFLDEIKSPECFDNLAVRMVEMWMKQEDSQIENQFVTELRSERLASRLSQLRSTLLVPFGNFVSTTVTKRVLDRAENSVTCWLDIELERGHVTLEISWDVDAFSAWTSAFQILKPTP